jgi:hypothetical protein
MTVELQPILNLAFGGVSGIAMWLFAQGQSHEKRIQKIENVKDLELAAIKKEVADLDKKVVDGFHEINEKLTTLSTNIHKQKNEENALNGTLTGVNKTMIVLGDLIEKIYEKVNK